MEYSIIIDGIARSEEGRGGQQILNINVARTFEQSVFNEIHTMHTLKSVQKA